MARIVKLAEAKDLELPGRRSLQILPDGDSESPLTLRYVEIPPSSPDETPRAPHLHGDCEECIHVLSGRGVFRAGDDEQEIRAGDTILVPAGEPHVTHNTGDDALVLLCYFPLGDLGAHG